MAVTRLRGRKELNRLCLKGGYLINIDPEENVIHTCECKWTSKMDPQKTQGGSYYCKDYVEAIEWLKENHPKFKECSDCLPGNRHKSKD